MLLLNKTLLRLARGLWQWILAIAAVSFLTLVGTTALAEIVSQFLGSLFEPQVVLSTVKSAVGAAFLASVFTFLAQLVKGLIEYKTAAKARSTMRKTIFSKVMELDAGGIEKIGPTSAITAAVDAVEQMQAYFSSYLPSLIFSVIAPIYLFFHLKNISLIVAVLLLFVSLILFPLHNVFRGKIEALRKTYWRSLDDMTGYYMDGLRGLTTLKLFDRDREHSRVLGEKADVLNKNINAFMKINFTSFLVTELLIYAAITVSLVICITGMRNGDITIAQALTVLMLSYSYFSAIRQLMSASHSALTAISAAGKVEEILQTDTSRPYNPELPADPEHFDGIRMEHVSYGYEGRSRALQDVSLTIPRGSSVALVGLSGCGKSTAASLLMRFCDPDQGTIFIEGKEYRSVTPQQFRTNIAMVPQQVNLFSGTIRENLLLADPNANDEKLKEALSEAGLGSFLKTLPKGLDSDVGNAGAALSGGQRQKMGIARALLSEAQYMIFDEATSSVDPQSEREIWETIGRLSKTRTLIIISHRMSTIQNANCIYVLEKGVVAQRGSHAELMQQGGLYRELVTRQQAMEVAE
ncbi:ATP-binding cassette domain-containing protein [Anthropogastromicrobium aceti]|uniref:ABC transporter ATP-binding protein/permease n=1 Tax=Anthropogastromicrobium TaxID=2981630 RepID=UPI000822A85A|nr:ATP-binding cassette domain-containing protein [Anthropogastromicrobium aceti]MCU6785426.1 ATP-binding cassette domain-containing protein [Anthropogastromicrobium aceti]SCJ86867.1 Putative multidrug export ATP-binding/permease protein SAV1866 [uncultured Lachnospira sp.]